MDKQQAQKIIRETFESSFDKSNFTKFIKNLLNRIDDAPFTYQGKYIPDAYKQYIKTLERIGKFSDGENSIEILVITLQKEKSLERARTMQRNFIAWYLNGSRGGEKKDTALAAFVSPGKNDWRFSLVKMDYKFEKTKSGKMKVKEEFTPARRWSFLVGKNEKSHTAQSRLINILANDKQDPTLKEIEKAFDIEIVTKEFFLKYRELFLRTKEELDKVVQNDPKIKADFEKNGVDTVNFAKKLLGQIIFLYFLQKKGWFGVGRDDNWGTGSKHFLRELFKKKHADYNNFFNDILEPLFYEALRIDRSHDDGYYSRFDCKIPFLNGGLFDPIGNYDWVHTDIIIPDRLFSNDIKTKEGDAGTGILDVFDRYNFTVKEDEPLEKEVAIDPELLGKSYEKFNAIRPDNFDEFQKALKSGKTGEENKFNKKFGVYYTPREIVHYMCQQSLINYLHTEVIASEAKQSLIPSKEDIETLIHIGEQVSENEARVLSKGKETKTYSHQLPESIRKNAKQIDAKLAEITVCDPAVGSGAFPVGMMSEIIKTRNVLTLFLRSEARAKPPRKEAKQSQFDDKRAVYNFKRQCIERSLYGVDIDPGAVEIAKLRLWLSLVVDEEDIKNIKPLPNLDYKIVCGNSLLGVEKDLFNAHLFSELERLKPPFFNETNPTKKQEYKKQIDKLINEITSGHTEFDFEVYFSEVFHNKGGFDVVIANPPYGETIKYNKKYFKENYHCTEGKYEIYKYFIEKGLSLLNNIAIIAYITPDTWLTLGYFKKLRKIIICDNNLTHLTLPLYNMFEAATVDTIVSLIKKNGSDNIIVWDLYKNNKVKEIRKELCENDKEYIINIKKISSIIKKIDNSQINLKDITEIWQGLIAYSSKKQPREFTSEKKLTRLHRKLLYGSDLGRYYITWKKGHYLKYGNWLHRPRPYYIFDRDKILVQRIRNPKLKQRIIATIDRDKYLNGTGLSNILVLEKFKEKYFIESLLGIINSKLINYWFSYYFHDVNIKPEQLRKITINYDEKIFQILKELVEQILTITKDEDYLQNPQKQAQVKMLEREIDQLVYKLYDLTPEEIKIVEGENE